MNWTPIPPTNTPPCGGSGANRRCGCTGWGRHTTSRPSGSGSRENRQRYARDYSYHRYRPVPVQRIRPRRLRLDGSLSGVRQIGGFRGLYFHYCYCLGLLHKNSPRRSLSPELREECRRLDAISRQAQLICREKLDTAEEVRSFISGKQSEMKKLGAARQHCYNRLRRCDDEEEIAKIKGQRDRADGGDGRLQEGHSDR